MKTVLASASPRRRSLLTQAGIPFEAVTSDIDENIGERDPAQLVTKLARAKAECAARMVGGDALIIGCDTVVFIDGEILGKPESPAHAFEMLTRLSGRKHTVYTGLALLRTASGDCEVTVDQTDVFMSKLSDEEIRAYVETGEPMGKAGAYGIQDRAALFVERIEGDYFTVVGLPLYRLRGRLER